MGNGLLQALRGWLKRFAPSFPPEPQAVLTRQSAMALSGECIAIPDGIVEIADGALEGHKGLARALVPGSVRRIGARAFADCPDLEHVVLSEGLECIEHNAFTGCAKLRSITLPDSATQADGRAFYRCGLTEPVYSASGDVLYFCPAPAAGSEFAVPDGVRRIGRFAFRDLPDLLSVRLPEGLKRIDAMAFVHCGLQSIAIPAGTTQLGDGAFYHCDALADISLAGRHDAVRIAALRCSLQGVPLLRPARCEPPADDRYWREAAFQALARACAKGDAEAMDRMTAFFEERSRRAPDARFYDLAANFWRFRADAHGSLAQKARMTEQLAASDGRLPSACLTERLEGNASGRALNALGFLFFDADRSYSLAGMDEDGVVEVSAYAGEDGPDEDGFGREINFDWWYLDDRLCPVPGADCLAGYSNGDKSRLCAAHFERCRAVVARAVLARAGLR